MRRMLARVFAFTAAFVVLAAWWLPQTAQAQVMECPPEVDAEAYVLMDAATGQVLVEKNAHLLEYPASITKVLTIALALEKAEYPAALDDQIEVGGTAVNALIPGAAHVALAPGEVVSLRDMLYAAQIESGNDAANVLAEYTAGSMEAFAEMMNQKAADLGLSDSHFVNANGLPDAAHVTTAYDMAAITRWALGVPGFREVFLATNYDMAPTNSQPAGRVFHSSNLMLLNGSTQYYNGIIGSKSGYTDDARYTLVSAAQRGDTELVCVVLHCARNEIKYTSTTALLDYGFDNFTRVSLSAAGLSQSTVPVYGGGEQPLGDITVCGGEDGAFLLHNSLSLEDVTIQYAVPEKYVIGQPFHPEAVLTLNGDVQAQCVQLGTVPLAWNGLDAVVASNTGGLSRVAQQYPVVFWTVVGVLSVLAFLATARILLVRHKRNKRRLARLAAARAQLPIRVADRPSPATRREVPLRPAPDQNRRRPAGAAAPELQVAYRPQQTGTYAASQRRAGGMR